MHSAVWPAALAVIVTAPAIFAVTLPFASTVAIFLSEDFQVIFPVAPLSVALSVSVLPHTMLSFVLLSLRDTSAFFVGSAGFVVGLTVGSAGFVVGLAVGVAVAGAVAGAVVGFDVGVGLAVGVGLDVAVGLAVGVGLDVAVGLAVAVASLL